ASGLALYKADTPAAGRFQPMARPDTAGTDVAQADLLNALLRIEDGSALAELRAQRPEATRHTQGSYEALFSGKPTTAVSPIERFATALRVSTLHGEPAFVDHFAGRLRATSGASEQLVADVLAGHGVAGLPPRLRAMLAHADLLVIRPAAATPADLQALQTVGLSDAEIITVSQLIAFVSFLIRVFVGLSLLRGDERTASATMIGPRDATASGFTQEQLGWAPWIVPFE